MPDSFLRLVAKVQLSKHHDPIKIFHLATLIKILNRNIATILAHSNTDLPFILILKLTLAKRFAAVSARFRVNHLVSLPCLIVDLILFIFCLGIDVCQCLIQGTEGSTLQDTGPFTIVIWNRALRNKAELCNIEWSFVHQNPDSWW